MEAQGYGIQENIVYQDNKSAILEKNDKASGSKSLCSISTSGNILQLIRSTYRTSRLNGAPRGTWSRPTFGQTRDKVLFWVQG